MRSALGYPPAPARDSLPLVLSPPTIPRALLLRIASIVIASAALATLGAACATHTQQIRVDDVLAEARRNELLTLKRYRDQRVSVTGRVVGSGSLNHQVLEASVLWYTATVRSKTESRPFVQLVDRGGGSSPLICFFDQDEPRGMAKLNTGAEVTVHGDFLEISHGPAGAAAVVLTGCEVQ